MSADFRLARFNKMLEGYAAALGNLINLQGLTTFNAEMVGTFKCFPGDLLNRQYVLGCDNKKQCGLDMSFWGGYQLQSRMTDPKRPAMRKRIADQPRPIWLRMP